jgi:hypothetical protein
MSITSPTVDPRANLPITETWNRTDWSYFDTYQSLTDGSALGRNAAAGYPFGLNTQAHIDVRNFLEGTWTASGGTVSAGYKSALNHMPAAAVTTINGTTILYGSYNTPIDLTALNDPNALLTLALPSFSSSVTLNQSYLELSSDGFAETLLQLPFSVSTPAPSAGNSSLTFPYSGLTGDVDLSAVTGVRFVIQATAAATIYLAALRMIGSQWVQTNVDFDNLSGVVRQTMPLNGNTSTTSLDIPSNKQMPIVLRSALIPGDDDPRPINAEMSVLFNTGSQTGNNSITIFTRELTTAFITQIDLEGDSQASLTGVAQPTSGVSEYIPRTMADIDNFSMTQLDAMTMLNLDRTPDPVYISCEAFTITFGPQPQVQVTNSANSAGGYIYSGPTLTNNTTYAAVFNVTDTSARLWIYNVNQTTLAIGTSIFDTTLIPDSSMFQRHGGRIGFQSFLVDGDAWMGPIRPRGLVFAEYQSDSLRSITPVKGARLYVTSTANNQYFTAWSALSDGTNAPTLAADTTRSTTGSSTSVTITTPSSSEPAQGVVSNALSADAITGLTDFDNLGISFDVWFPSAALNNSLGGPILACALVSATGYSMPLLLPDITPDHWQHMILQPANPLVNPQSGIYQLVFYYNSTVAATFWLDNVQVIERAVAWSARSVSDDPWNSNFAPWTPFKDFLNSDSDGVRFSPQGNELQLRGQALQQNAAILSSPKLVPVYAQLGRLVWPELLYPNGSPIQYGPSTYPTAAITATNTGLTYSFSGSTSTGAPSAAPNNFPTTLTNYEWEFSDGTFASGMNVVHTFPTTESLPLITTLTIRDSWGQTATTQYIVS